MPTDGPQQIQGRASTQSLIPFQVRPCVAVACECGELDLPRADWRIERVAID
jgi:hypothetical protein